MKVRDAIVAFIAANQPVQVEDLYAWLAKEHGSTVHSGAKDLRILRREGRIVREAWTYRLLGPGEQVKLWA